MDNMHGADFAQLLSEHLGNKNFGVIKQNSEKSKHLETATIRVHGTFIDLVNLRSEKYAEDSRIPVIDIGTAEEDALRRDFTVNALFYNLNEEKVEDLTGKGLEDLRYGRLRTPLEPLQTFKDDPLRVLRAIRFSARLGFAMVPELELAARDAQI